MLSIKYHCWVIGAGKLFRLVLNAILSWLVWYLLPDVLWVRLFPSCSKLVREEAIYEGPDRV